MLAEPRAEVNVNPFASPINRPNDDIGHESSTTRHPRHRRPFARTAEGTRDPLFHRRGTKRKALKELEYLILGSNSAEGSPRSPVCPTNQPTTLVYALRPHVIEDSLKCVDQGRPTSTRCKPAWTILRTRRRRMTSPRARILGIQRSG
ncbi:hypothetical protein JVT61DRAFT_4724 [Boletus reticuloceps]|uniref:Uncharacterized protein n=1 Tax=Boletus reticuloceps TaxID=495285 RepID=A0A8I2YLR2_9AGAM|nr:hypothetical protein JVT61DRAFT_4724 [Boletus reticuloceps]